MVGGTGRAGDDVDGGARDCDAVFHFLVFEEGPGYLVVGRDVAYYRVVQGWSPRAVDTPCSPPDVALRVKHSVQESIERFEDRLLCEVNRTCESKLRLATSVLPVHDEDLPFYRRH